MTDKRRGLGRGLGALIPAAPPPTRPAGDRPVDVFFPGPPSLDEDGRARVDAPLGHAGPPRAADLDVVPAQDGDATDGSGAGGGTGEPKPADPAGDADRAVAGSATPADGLVAVPGATFAELPVDDIAPNPRQPRQVFDDEALAELAHSIREIGVLQPVVVRKVDAADHRYELIMGERRWRATREAGLATIPAIIRDTSDDDLLRDALLENLHRSDLNALEEAAAYQQLLDDFGCTHDELAGRLGRSRPQISNTIRLLRLPPAVQRRVAAGVLSAGHARALLGLEESEGMENLAQRIVAEGLSVRAVEEIVSLADAPAAKQAKRRPRAGANTPELDHLASRLGDRLETRVSVALGRNRGRLSIDFASVDDLNRIVGLLAPDVQRAFATE